MSTTTLMRAATITEHSKPLTILNVPKPEPKANRILVRITASSLCMSDILGQQGHTPNTLPYCGGHERGFYFIVKVVKVYY
jgi:Zn-dependent alcohol dehydrogenase